MLSGRRPRRLCEPRQQLFPVGKIDVIVEHHHCGEETLAFGDAAADPVPQRAHLIADGVESKGDEVQCQQQIGQSLLTVAEVMLDVIMPISALSHKCRHSFYADTSSHALDWKGNAGIFIGIKSHRACRNANRSSLGR